MPTTRVFLLRHAETATPNVFHGAESDVVLSPRGQKQAELIAAELVRTSPDVVYSSAMRRAQQTARVIAGACQTPHFLEPNLHERRVGKLSGMPYSTEDIWPETVRRWSAGETSYAHDGAESFDDVRRRVLPIWEEIASRHPDETAVVVAHGIVCKVLLLTLFPELTWPGLGSIRNVAITELVRNGDHWQAVRINELPERIAQLPME